MNKFLFFLLLLFNSAVFGQNTFTTTLKDSSANEFLVGAFAKIKGSTNVAIADREGKVTITNIPNGTQTIVFSYSGYEKMELELNFPLEQVIPMVCLEPLNVEMEQILVVGTRSNRSIAKIPTRVEVLTEEIDEAATMDPSKIAHLLTHSTGIQVQQTSATSNTANVGWLSTVWRIFRKFKYHANSTARSTANRVH